MSNQCCQSTCTSKATHIVYWPGTDGKLMCEDDALCSQGIAKAMGFHVAIRELAREREGDGG